MLNLTKYKEQLLWLAVQKAHKGFQFVLIDEAQFCLSQVKELADMSEMLEIYCYGCVRIFRAISLKAPQRCFVWRKTSGSAGRALLVRKKATMNTRR